MTYAAEADLMAMLARLGINALRHAHPPLHSVEDSQALRGDLPGAHTKNLFLKDKKGEFLLVSCLEGRAIRVKDVARAAGTKPPSFAKPEDLWNRLGVRPGAVTPFALINDVDQRVRLVLDRQMMAHDVVNFHPLHNEATLALTPADLMRFFAATGHDPLLLDFDALEIRD
ncbi:MAG: Ala-tRNA(Pro) deacylase [Paracoccaceae bacterium]|jgi:Ala-tRNA(Pro) deacylase